MMPLASAELCRLVVCGPDRRLEVAVPTQILVADLLPALLSHLGEELSDAGLLHGGWVLQRLGSPPFDEDSTVASLGIRDGDTVHLRPRSEQLPPVDFDDLIDGMATGLSKRPGLWRPEMTRWAALGLLAVLTVTGMGVLVLPGPLVPRVIVAAMLAVACLAAGSIIVHTVADRGFGIVLGLAATGYAGLGGLLAPRPDTATAAATEFAAPQAFSGGVAVCAAAAVGVMLIGPARPYFYAVLAAAAVSVAGFALVVFTPVTGAQVAGVVAVAATVLGTAVPQLGFRIAGLRLDPLPTKPEHLQENLDPEPSEPLLERTPVVDRVMTTLYFGLALPAGVALALLTAVPGWAPTVLVVLLALVRVLAARPMSSAWHRMAQTTPAVIGLVGVALHGAAGSPTVQTLVAAGLVPAGAAVLFVIARTLPLRRPMPYWGRAGDLLQTLAMVAVLPVLLAILGVYDLARGLGG